eukprot:1326803-Alexandrium_andersonii.AAC.1
MTSVKKLRRDARVVEEASADAGVLHVGAQEHVLEAQAVQGLTRRLAVAGRRGPRSLLESSEFRWRLHEAGAFRNK